MSFKYKVGEYATEPWNYKYSNAIGYYIAERGLIKIELLRHGNLDKTCPATGGSLVVLIGTNRPLKRKTCARRRRLAPEEFATEALKQSI